eukprot:Colp12_sorted_trinity150504_noHs@28487
MICLPREFSKLKRCFLGGQALTRFVLDNPTLFHKKRIFELGAGCGATSIAAIMSGCSHVLANDIDPYALECMRLNMEHNGVCFDVSDKNYLSGIVPTETEFDFDVVLAGDMCYDDKLSRIAVNLFKQLAQRGITIFVGDPGRAYLPKLRPVEKYPMPVDSQQENYGLQYISVYQFQ